MATVTATEVKEIIATDLADATVDVFITAADRIVDVQLADKGIADATLKEVKRWLAAHLVSVRVPQARLESLDLGDLSESYGGEYGRGLASSLYGQMALALDPSGTLAAQGKESAELRAL